MLCFPDTGNSSVDLKTEFKALHGYRALEEFALKLADSYAPPPSPSTPILAKLLSPHLPVGKEKVQEPQGGILEEEALSIEISEKPRHQIFEKKNEGSPLTSESVISPSPNNSNVIFKLLNMLGELAKALQITSESEASKGAIGIHQFFRSVTGKRLEISSPAKPIENSKIGDPEAMVVLHHILLKSGKPSIQGHALKLLETLLHGHPKNFAVFHEKQILVEAVRSLPGFSQPIREKVLGLLSYVTFVANVVPEQELMALCLLIEKPVEPSLSKLVLDFFNNLLTFEGKFKETLSEVGFLDVLLLDLEKCPNEQQSSPQNQKENHSGPPQPPVSHKGPTRSFSSIPDVAGNSEQNGLSNRRRVSMSVPESSGSPGPGPSLSQPHLFSPNETQSLAWSCLLKMIKDNPVNRKLFRLRQGPSLCLAVIPFKVHRSHALEVLISILCADSDLVSAVVTYFPSSPFLTYVFSS